MITSGATYSSVPTKEFDFSPEESDTANVDDDDDKRIEFDSSSEEIPELQKLANRKRRFFLLAGDGVVSVDGDGDGVLGGRFVERSKSTSIKCPLSWIITLSGFRSL